MKLMSIRTIVLCLLLLSTQAAHSGEYPDRLIKFIVPFAAGGATDVAGRLVAEGFKNRLGQPVLVENKPGASGALGVDAVAKSKPDGYTLGVSGVGPSAILGFIDPSLPYSPTNDLDIIGGINTVAFILCARDDFPGDTVLQLFILHEELARIGGTKMSHIPYRGESPIVNALLSHDIDIAYISAAIAPEYIKTGKLKALGAGGPARSPAFPDLPTIAEQTGVSAYSAYVWTALVAPKGLPTELLQKLNTTLNEVLSDPAIKDKLDHLGLAPLGGDVPTSRAFIAKELTRYETMIRENQIRRE